MVSAFDVPRICWIVVSRYLLLPSEISASMFRNTRISLYRTCRLQECVGLLKIGRRPARIFKNLLEGLVLLLGLSVFCSSSLRRSKKKRPYVFMTDSFFYFV